MGWEKGKSREKESRRYDDIIGLPHPVSAVHPQMPQADRAAQFSPFAALTGYEDAIEETGRLTDTKIELDEDAKSILDEKLRQLLEEGAPSPEASITYFLQDPRKEGGSYITVTGRVKRLDACGRYLLMQDGTKIPMEDILEIEAGK